MSVGQYQDQYVHDVHHGERLTNYNENEYQLLKVLNRKRRRMLINLSNIYIWWKWVMYENVIFICKLISFYAEIIQKLQ